MQDSILIKYPSAYLDYVLNGAIPGTALSIGASARVKDKTILCSCGDEPYIGMWNGTKIIPFVRDYRHIPKIKKMRDDLATVLKLSRSYFDRYGEKEYGKRLRFMKNLSTSCMLSAGKDLIDLESHEYVLQYLVSNGIMSGAVLDEVNCQQCGKEKE
jgi:hypothetical protein